MMTDILCIALWYKRLMIRVTIEYFNINNFLPYRFNIYFIISWIYFQANKYHQIDKRRTKNILLESADSKIQEKIEHRQWFINTTSLTQ